MNKKTYFKIRKIVNQYSKNKDIKKAVDNKEFTLLERMLIARLCKKIFLLPFRKELIRTKTIDSITKKYTYKNDCLVNENKLEKDMLKVENDFHLIGATISPLEEGEELNKTCAKRARKQK